MRDLSRLYSESLTGANPFERYLTPRFEFADLVSFAQNKTTPVYNWFYYKEGFSRDFVWGALKELAVKPGSIILDPYCGTGTTLLAAKQMGYPSVGSDILPLGVFVSKVKLEDQYDIRKLEDGIRRISALKFGEPASRLVDIKFLDMRKAFSQYARKDIPFFREQILAVEDERVRDFLLLGLLSIVGQASNVKKDGGVLRIVRKQHLPPVRYLLKNKLKRMLKDLKKAKPAPKVPWDVRLGDARSLDLDDASVDACITSPPYLNFVDYTKLYALELSLLVSSNKEIVEFRRKSMRSHISAARDGAEAADVKSAVDHAVESAGESPGTPEVVYAYLADLHASVREAARTLKPGGTAVFVVGNAALPAMTVDVDLALAEMGGELGLSVKDIWVANVRWADVQGIKKPRPVRESAVVLEKT